MVLMREVNILWGMDHPNIIKLKEVVHVSQEDDEEGEDANWFLVMEFVEHDLKDVIMIMKTPFTEPQVLPRHPCSPSGNELWLWLSIVDATTAFCKVTATIVSVSLVLLLRCKAAPLFSLPSVSSSWGGGWA